MMELDRGGTEIMPVRWMGMDTCILIFYRDRSREEERRGEERRGEERRGEECGMRDRVFVLVALQVRMRMRMDGWMD